MNDKITRADLPGLQLALDEMHDMLDGSCEARLNRLIAQAQAAPDDAPQASAAQSDPSTGIYSIDPLACPGCAKGCFRCMSKPQSAPAGEREAMDAAFHSSGLTKFKDTYAAGWEACASWQRTQSSGVPDDAMVDVASAAYEREALAGATHEQAWHAALSEAFAAAPAKPTQPALTVWEGAMPESNGKSNFTAVLMRKGDRLFDGLSGGMTIARSEYPDRVRYEADRVRYLIGELQEEPCIIDYDAEKHSGYSAPAQPAAHDQGEVQRLREALNWLRGAINCTAENDVDQCGAWISTKHPMIQRIDELLAASTGQEVK